MDKIIKRNIAKAINLNKEIAIVPYGKNGKDTKKMLNSEFGITEKIIFDNYKANGKSILSITDMNTEYINCVFLLTSSEREVASALKKQLKENGVRDQNIISIFFEYGDTLELGYGYKEDFVFWKRQYIEALKGMNIGEGGEVNFSGEREVFTYAKRYMGEVECIFDVGANVGKYIEEVHKFFPNAIIHAFEPGKSTFRTLVNNQGKFTNIFFNNLAVSDNESETRLYYDKKESGLASLYKRDLEYLDISFNESEVIKCTTLGSYCEKNNISNIDILKMDIEGHEYKALCGAKKLLEEKRIKIIQIEFGGCNIDSRTFFKDFWNLLHNNYKVFRIMQDGLVEIPTYEETLEIFITTNYVFILKDICVLSEVI